MRSADLTLPGVGKGPTPLWVPSHSSCRMKALSLLLLPALGLLVCGRMLCPVDEAMNEKIQDVTRALILQVIRNIGLDCRTISNSGDLATCPRGFAVTGCACGSACGSWDVRAETTCHCQCKGMDWTAARCCRMQLAA
ncbi:PREDICTED: resistin [Ceratotherium simum simum]|uniref:Resistin n=1 Tax=Ceratotherium simum simum TaxID=73337 RepID=A0ABM0IA41_CERSS|nr:PREDICTED: resistin [Ceratotherium simum simum]